MVTYNNGMEEPDLIDMDTEWNNSQPIYLQLRDFVVAMILEGSLSEGDVLPSVRRLAAEFRVKSTHRPEQLSPTGGRRACQVASRARHVRQPGRPPSVAGVGTGKVFSGGMAARVRHAPAARPERG